eukprot:2731001-Pleurochrysis_carterae.AAC.1
MAEKVAEESIPLGSNTTGCSLSLAGTGGDFEKTRAPVDRAVGKHAKVRDVGVVGLPGSVRVERQRRGKCRNAALRWSCRRAQGSCLPWNRGSSVVHKATKHEGVVENAWSSHRGRVEAASDDLEADELVDTSGDLAREALDVSCCKLVKEVFVLVGVGDGEVVDTNDDEEERAVALVGEGAR